MEIATMNNQFALEVLEGLNSVPKRLSSKYFYDKKGDALFQKIMKLDEYYLTRSEYEILETYKNQLLDIFSHETNKFNLVEFGAGDGYKTKVLLKCFLEEGVDFQYVPIDISGNVLQILKESLMDEYPALQVKTIQNDYFRALKELENGHSRNVVLFLGSNIGNFSEIQAVEFLKKLADELKEEDLLMIGFDLKKDPSVILKAYNDAEDVTRDFNLNLLHRINEELDGNFDISKFKHFPVYNPMTGTTTSYLVSKEKQKVKITDQVIEFDPWEAIHMEVSQKYDINDIENMAFQAGFSVINNFYDNKRYFVNSIWQK